MCTKLINNHVKQYHHAFKAFFTILQETVLLTYIKLINNHMK